MALHLLKNGVLTIVPATSFPAEGVMEVRDMQPAVVAAIDSIVPGVLVIDCEHMGWEGNQRSIDILAIDKLGQLVVIELKRTTDAGAADLQALRYAAMVSTYSFERIAEVFEAYLAKKNLPPEHARESLREHLDPDVDVDGMLSSVVRTVLVSAGFSKEITSTVLWLNSQGLDISCVRLRPYKLGDQLVVDADQIIPLPEAEDFVLAQRRKQTEIVARAVAGRDYTKYAFVTPQGTIAPLNKRELMLAVVRAVFGQGVSPVQMEAAVWRTLFVAIPGTMKASAVLLARPDVARDRFFSADGQELNDRGNTYLLSKQWGKRAQEAAERILALLPNRAGYSIETVV